MRFRHAWRAYQAVVLDNLESHLEDDRLHVSAAPGAGKTVLGLEVMRRLAKPTLILSPALSIRTQWVQRLVDGFLDDDAPPDWVSTDLRRPAPVTVSTYQALHALGDPAPLVEYGFAVLMLDEAHHLRRAWWEALDHLAERLAPQVVALTATPPYDVSSAEWRRYDALCGPLDAEIGIPELVRSGDLAPHRDLVHLSRLDGSSGYVDPSAHAAELREALRRDPEMLALLQDHPWIADAPPHVAAILDDPELLSAMLIYLADAEAPLPSEPLRILGVGRAQLPRLGDEWLQVLFAGLKDTLPEALVARLRKAGALRRGRVTIPPPRRGEGETLLRDASGKARSIAEILTAERAAQGAHIRCAILCEHVGRDALTLAARDPGHFAPGGPGEEARADAGSLFERLRHLPGPADLAVLTGSVCIVPAGVLDAADARCTPLAHDTRYERVDFDGGNDRRVAAISALVAEGRARVLIGTRALLGQGWDLPAVNTLILATNVSSFVSTNQLRGRAIRRDPARPHKVANIWHLATIAPDGGGPELEALRARFDTFVHLDERDGVIQSGFDAFGENPSANAAEIVRAADRDGLAASWERALVTGRPEPRIRHHLETAHLPRGLVRRDAITRGLPPLALAGGIGASWATLGGGLAAGAVSLLACAGLAVPVIRQARRVWRHGSLGGSMRQTAGALVHAMTETGLIRTPADRIGIETGTTPDGLTWCTLSGVTLPEETRSLSAIEELFAPIDNPRYLILRETYLGRHLRAAPYPVPRDLGARKEQAQALLDGWHRHVGPARLVYTRTVAGRLALLQSRLVVTAEARKVHRRSVWE